MENERHTHVVLDLIYLPEEGQECFSGSEIACNNWISEQSSTIGYDVKPKIN